MLALKRRTLANCPLHCAASLFSPLSELASEQTRHALSSTRKTYRLFLLLQNSNIPTLDCADIKVRHRSQVAQNRKLQNKLYQFSSHIL
ncbi:hypothetical protein VNO77_44379 [Canavalia gladiata]|uniref:Uncharacterized protein n=1 Tax=Canavalia gladiata TaxID=3824 RepID=A0AAN9PQB0_CANGL